MVFEKNFFWAEINTSRFIIFYDSGKVKKNKSCDLRCRQCFLYVFGVAEPESGLRIGPSRQGSALTSKTEKLKVMSKTGPELKKITKKSTDSQHWDLKL